jgi:DNA-binding protein HU-beta
VNKAQLIEALAAYYDGSKTEAAKALNAVVQTITYKTAGGEKVSITGFGVFEKVPRAARMVRNPRTGERKRAKATAVPRFRAGSDLKAYVSGAKKVPRATAKKAATAAKAPTKAPATKAAATRATATKASPAKKVAAKAPARKAPAKKAAAKR